MCKWNLERGKKGGEGSKKKKKQLDDIMTKNSPNLVKDINLQIQEAQ